MTTDKWERSPVDRNIMPKRQGCASRQVIPAEAVEAAAKALYELGFGSWENAHADTRAVQMEDMRAALEAAAPYMLIHVHHHDIEKHAESFNEGYETCMAQELADDPTTAQDWLDEKLRLAKAEAWEQGRDAEFQRSVMKRQTDPNPYILNNEGEK